MGFEYDGDSRCACGKVVFAADFRVIGTGMKKPVFVTAFMDRLAAGSLHCDVDADWSVGLDHNPGQRRA